MLAAINHPTAGRLLGVWPLAVPSGCGGYDGTCGNAAACGYLKTAEVFATTSPLSFTSWSR
jgi:hypothetical protein